jgi:NOL1/NOP2/fmu family ribosome biogenesis protein
LIQSLISPESLLVSNEVIKTRVPVLNQNMTKWGRANGIVTHCDPAHFKQLPGFFDLIIIDAPCSGSGLFRKDPESAASWNPELVNLCSHRQQRILADAWDTLKEDGFLIYSTCSYSEEENEDILDMILHLYAGESIPLSPNPDWNIIETFSKQAGANGYRFYPDKVSGEGFFLSVVQKKQAVSSHKSGNTLHSNKLKKYPARISKSAEHQINQWMKENNLYYLPVGDSIHALPSGLLNDFEILKNNLYLKKAGIRIGKSGENDLIPDHELALSNFLKDDCPSIHVSISEAYRFLRGESFESGNGERGWRAVSYEGQRLGWVKLLGKRMNNYYPKSWRIRI